MNSIMTSPPRTIMQVFKTLPEGTLAEVIDNKLYMSPAPNPFHQRISRKLSVGFSNFVDQHSLGEVFVAPIDLYLDEDSNAVQPDILFILNDNPLRIDKEGLHGVPDMIIEILSPGNKDHDKIRKKDLYEKFGVSEYWIVDPDTRKATGYFLQGKAYQEIGAFKEKIKSITLEEAFTY